MKKILNLTQHLATRDQVAAGVVDLSGRDLERLLSAITFDDLPSEREIRQRAKKVLDLVHRHPVKVGNYLMLPAVMIGGAPYFMPVLQRVLKEEGCEVLYAFARRESVDTVSPDGSIHKTSVFRHAGFVSAA
jgi:hypothetical protein